MTCIDFINSIGLENTKTLIGNYFDQTMALYKICGASNFSHIKSIIDNNMITFELVFANSDDAIAMLNILSISHTIIIYNVFFSIEYEQIDDLTINIRLNTTTPL